MKLQWTPEELEDLWTLHPGEISLVTKKTGANKLGFALLLKCFQVTSLFPKNTSDIPESVVLHVAKQLEISIKVVKAYTWSPRISETYRRQIREYLGFREFKESDISEIEEWLILSVLPEGNFSLLYLYEKVNSYLKINKIEKFSKTQMERYVRSALHKFETDLFQKISEAITDTVKESLFDLVEHQEKQDPQSYYLRHLRQDAGNVSLAGFVRQGG